MNRPLRIKHAATGVQLSLLFCFSGMMFLVIPGACQLHAHDLFSKYIQHALHLTVDAEHIDLEVLLTFFEEESAKERKAIDADGNGILSPIEKKTYLDHLSSKLEKSLVLRVGGRELSLAFLYEPELEFLRGTGTGSGYHRLRLFLFAPANELKIGDDIVIEDRLWTAAMSFGSLKTTAHDGCRLKAGSSEANLPEGGTGKLCFKIRCLGPLPNLDASRTPAGSHLCNKPDSPGPVTNKPSSK